jgi:DNA-directed RNA polymerase subunit M/transcription elongation factor TFIIS
MVRRLQCPNCGDHGWLISDESTVVPVCQRCGHRLDVERAESRLPLGETRTIDDDVVSWMSQLDAAKATAPSSQPVAKCSECGFEGLTPFDSPKGDTICLACFAVSWTGPRPVCQLVDCPNCQVTIEVYESDRGKTIVCSDCHYFLGCVLLPEKRRFEALPFLNTLLGPGKK